jgi:UDP-glucose 4-epimerase
MTKGRILVTGGLGYIGSHTVVELQQTGFDVIIVDNLSNSREDVKERIEAITGKTVSFYKEDITDPEGLKSIFNKRGSIDAVIHFAAHLFVDESVREPLMYYHNNITGLITLLNAMKKYGCHKMIFSSSCTVYGDTKVQPVTEETPIQAATSPYGSTKIMGEMILKDVSLASDLKTVSLRYFNPIGAHPTALIGEVPHGIPGHIVPFITQTASGIRKELTVFGGDYNTPDGTCVRDYIHVVDVARAHVKALDYVVSQKEHFTAFNLGTGQGSSVLDVIKAFEGVTGLKLNYKIGGRRVGDVEQVWADTSKANNELGWVAALDLSEMMKSAWDWEHSMQSL